MTKTIIKLARRSRMRVAGLMSGTSADGIDAAIVDIGPAGVKLLAFETFPYPPGVRRQIFRLFDAGAGRVDDVCHMNFVLGELLAGAVIELARKAGIPLESIDLIGSHGQTIHHLPAGRAANTGRAGRPKVRSTLQIGEPCVIAERTGITTVADFRTRDIAAGGQGAPLVPHADLRLFGHRRKIRALQNIGGIANVTYLPAGAGIDDVLAFDTGPGNMMIDHIVAVGTGGRRKFDAGGKLAAAGRIDAKLLAELMRHKYLRRRPPKTTGREEFGARFAGRIHKRAKAVDLSLADVLATVTAFTAHSIADAYRRFLPRRPEEVIVCGGGVWNQTLMAMLRDLLAPAVVGPMEQFGLSADAKEAVSFAVLAYETIHGRPSNVPAATGAARRAVLGKIVPG